MANPRKPDNLHVLEGTYQKHRHGDLGEKPKWNSDFPDLPDCLDADAQEEWMRLAAIVPAGVITQTDRSAFAQYCALWSEFKKDPNGFPSSKHSQLKLVQQELGFTPISRSKIGGKPKEEKENGFRTNPA